MKTCACCGKENPEALATCLGFGSRLDQGANRTRESMARAEPIGPLTAAALALAVIWFPFLVGAALAGDRDINRSLFMLPGMFPALGSELVAYVAAGVMSLGMVVGGIAAARRSRKLFLGLMGIALAVLCGLALITILGMLV